MNDCSYCHVARTSLAATRSLSSEAARAKSAPENILPPPLPQPHGDEGGQRPEEQRERHQGPEKIVLFMRLACFVVFLLFQLLFQGPEKSSAESAFLPGSRRCAAPKTRGKRGQTPTGDSEGQKQAFRAGTSPRW